MQASTATTGPIDYGGGAADISIGALLDQASPQCLTADVSEILVYDHALSAQDQAKAEGYLADKYGLPDSSASWPLAYSSDVQALIASNGWSRAQADAYVSFVNSNPELPTAGLGLWLKSDAGIVQTNNVVTQWTDQSPYGNDIVAASGDTAPTVSSSAALGKPAVTFDGVQQYLSSPEYSGLATGGDDRTVLEVVAYGGDGWGGGISYGTNSSYEMFSVGVADNGAMDVDGWNNGLSFGSNLVGTGFVIEEASLASGTLSAYENGLSQGSATPTYNTVADGQIVVGAELGLYRHIPQSISEILVYNRSLSDSERQQAEAYLADKYGLYSPTATWPLAYSAEVQAMIVADRLTRLQAQAYSAFVATNPPLPTLGLNLWLQSEAGVAEDNSGNVLAWNDQSPYGNNAVASSAAPVTVLSDGTGGKPALHFAGNSYLSIPDTTTLQPGGITVLAVAKENSTANYQTLISRGYRESASWYWPYVSWDACLMGVNSSNYLRSAIATGGNLIENNAANFYDTSRPHVTAWKYNGNSQQVFLAGSLQASTASSGLLDYSGGSANICIGSRSDIAPGEMLQADVSEILVYDHSLSAQEQGAAEGYLADKYGLYDVSASWPLSYSSDVQEQIAAYGWNKDQADQYMTFLADNPVVPADGMTLWFKGDAGITTDNEGNVSQWEDQRSGIKAVKTNCTAPHLVPSSLNGMPGVSFDGTQRLCAPDYFALNGDFTMIFVGESNNPTVESYAISVGDTDFTDGQRAFGTYSPQNGMLGTWAGYAAPGPFLNAGEDDISEVVYTNANSIATFYERGNETGSSWVAMTPNDAGVTVGDVSTGNYVRTWNGVVNEVMVYNRALTDAERHSIEGYLSDKYGLYNQYATWPLAYDSEVQAQIFENHWSKAQADAFVTFVSANPELPGDGLAFWFKADVGITADANGQISRWVDQRFGITATLNSSNAPVLATNVLNGQPGVVFTGSERLSAPDNVPLNGDWTLIMFGESNDTSSERYAIGVGNYYSSGGTRGYGNNFNRVMLTTGDNYTNPAPFLLEGQDDISEAVYTQSNSAVTFYEQGAETGAGSVYVANENAGINIGDISNGNYPRMWDGTIHEILAYNRALTDGERHQIEGYLADKYGVYNANATWPLSFSGSVQAEIATYRLSKAQANAYQAFAAGNPVLPADGLTVWLKADAGVTADSNGKVSHWSDQGCLGNSAIQTSGSNQPTLITNNSQLNGQSVLQFDGSSSYLDIADNQSLQPSNGLTIIAAAQNSGSGQEDIVARELTYNYYGYWQVSPYYSYDLGVQPGNVERGYIGASGGADLSGSTPRPSQMSVQTLVYNGSAESLYDAGSIQGTTPVTGALDFGSGSRHDLLLGASGAFNGVSRFLSGQIAEVVMYDRPLSAAEQEQVEVYLADKYGLYHPDATWPLVYDIEVQSQIVQNQWTKGQADDYVAFENSHPELGPGLVLWLKADTGVTQDGSGNVTSWLDQMGGYDVTQAGTACPTFIPNDVNGSPALRFNGNQWLSSSASMGMGMQQGATLIAVAMSTNPSVTQASVFLGSGGPDSNRGLLYYQSLQCFDFCDNFASGNAIPPSSMFVCEAASLTSGHDAVNFYRNGTSTAYVPVSNVGALTPGITIGGSTDQYSPWQGDIAEVLVYDHQLSFSELSQVDSYLADKYGYYSPNATWPLAYSSDAQQQIALNGWNKVEADAYLAFEASNPSMLTNGLVLWLKADSGVTADSNGNVSSWADQTGNYTVSQTAVNGSQPTYVTNDLNGLPGLRFNGSQWLSYPGASSPSLQGDLTMITVCNSSNPSAQQYSVWLGATSIASCRALGYVNALEIFDTNEIACTGASSPGPGTFCAEGASLSQDLGEVTFYQNEAQTADAFISGLNRLNGPITIGAVCQGYGYGWQGDIAEVLLYDHKLSGSEWQQIGLYLSGKYGLPFTEIAPVISPNGGTFEASQSITITTDQANALIHYTIDGTTPTASSPTYSSAFSLSGSAFVQAAAFSSSGVQLTQVGTAQFLINDPSGSGLAAPPTAVTETSPSPNEIDLGWSSSSFLDYSEVYIYRSTNGGPYELIAIVDPSTISFADTDVVPTNTYRYEVGNYNQSGIGTSSPTAAISTGSSSTLTIQITTPSGAVPLP